MSEKPNWPVTVRSVESYTKAPNQRFLKVVFNVERSSEEYSFDIPMIVSGDIDDQHTIAVARNYFHRSMAALAEQTASWAIDAADLEGMKKAK